MQPLLLASWAVDQYRTAMDLTGEIEVVRTDAFGFRSGAQIVDQTAIVPVRGVIDFRASLLSDAGLVASSEAIRHDFARLMADDSVRHIVLDIDSPGGVFSGMPELGDDIFASRGRKPTTAVANPMAASGALWLGAAADRFLSLGSGQVGSLGALMLHQEGSRRFESAGVKNTVLRSPAGKADFNSLEPLTDESREHHQRQVDEIASQFVATMAKFRGVSRSQAESDFGQGRMLDARQAARVGLIDGVVSGLEDVIGSRPRRRLHPRIQLALASGAQKQT